MTRIIGSCVLEDNWQLESWIWSTLTPALSCYHKSNDDLICYYPRSWGAISTNDDYQCGTKHYESFMDWPVFGFTPSALLYWWLAFWLISCTTWFRYDMFNFLFYRCRRIWSWRINDVILIGGQHFHNRESSILLASTICPFQFLTALGFRDSVGDGDFYPYFHLVSTGGYFMFSDNWLDLQYPEHGMFRQCVVWFILRSVNLCHWASDTHLQRYYKLKSANGIRMIFILRWRMHYHRLI